MGGLPLHEDAAIAAGAQGRPGSAQRPVDQAAIEIADFEAKAALAEKYHASRVRRRQ